MGQIFKPENIKKKNMIKIVYTFTDMIMERQRKQNLINTFAFDIFLSIHISMRNSFTIIAILNK